MADRLRDMSRLAVDGADIIPWVAPGGGSISRSLRAKFDERVTPADKDATGDGVADDKAALAATEAVAPIIIQKNHRIRSNFTFTKPVRFIGLGRLTIDAGVTVTFAGGLTGPDRQIFYGSGVVAGLLLSKVIWFAGDVMNTAADAIAQLQKAADATPVSGAIEFPKGYFTIGGGTALALTKGQYVYGYGPYKSQVRCSSTVMNVFSFSTTIGGRVEGISVQCINVDDPTDGTVLDIAASFTSFHNILIQQAFRAISVGNCTGTRGSSFDIFNAMQFGVLLNNVNDVFLSQFLISAPIDTLTISSVTGTFQVGEVITSASGATATITQLVSATKIKAAVSNKNFAMPETITGGTSGATATVTAQVVPHSLGGLRLTNKVEALCATDGDIIGGVYSMLTDATTNAPNARPAYNKFTNVYFDSSDLGVYVDKCVEFDFNACWFSNRPGRGITIFTADGVRFTGGGAINCWTNGVFVTSSAKRVAFNGFAVRGNSQQASNTHAGIAIQAGTTDFSIIGCMLSGTIGFGTQAWGVAVASGASDRYVIVNNLVSGNGTGGVSDGGTGTNKTVSGNW
jgi:hypothetical protein